MVAGIVTARADVGPSCNNSRNTILVWVMFNRVNALNPRSLNCLVNRQHHVLVSMYEYFSDICIGAAMLQEFRLANQRISFVVWLQHQGLQSIGERNLRSRNIVEILFGRRDHCIGTCFNFFWAFWP